jgi:hypothetical protein
MHNKIDHSIEMISGLEEGFLNNQDNWIITK